MTHTHSGDNDYGILRRGTYIWVTVHIYIICMYHDSIYMYHESLSPHDSSILQQQCVFVCGMYVSWLIHLLYICIMTRSYVPWLVHMYSHWQWLLRRILYMSRCILCNILCITHDIYVPWLIHMCHVCTMTHSYVQSLTMSVASCDNSAQKATHIKWMCLCACCVVCCSVLQRVAARCSALQCVAVRCGVLQCVAVCWSVLQCIAGCCRVLQGVAGCCRVLQCVAVCCSVLHVARPTMPLAMPLKFTERVCVCIVSCVAMYCNVLQRVAVCCSVLQCVAVYCTSLILQYLWRCNPH